MLHIFKSLNLVSKPFFPVALCSPVDSWTALLLSLIMVPINAQPETSCQIKICHKKTHRNAVQFRIQETETKIHSSLKPKDTFSVSYYVVYLICVTEQTQDICVHEPHLVGLFCDAQAGVPGLGYTFTDTITQISYHIFLIIMRINSKVIRQQSDPSLASLRHRTNTRDMIPVYTRMSWFVL